MAKKPDLTVVKDFLFRYGERVGLVACSAIAVLLLVLGFGGAMGPGTPNNEPWDATLKKSANPINAQLNRQADPEAIKIELAKVKVPQSNWTRMESRVMPGAYININDNIQIGRNNPTILTVLPGAENFQGDYLYRGYVGYGVKPKGVLAVEAAAGANGPLGPGGAPPGVGPGGVPGMQGAGAGANNLAHVLKPRHMLVVSGIFPMKRQVDEFVKALRLRDVSELIANGEMPIVAGINVARLEIGPDGKPTTSEPTLFIYYDQRKKPATLYVDPNLNNELAEALIDHENVHQYRPLIHEGLITPLPELPEGVKYPKLTIHGEFWPKESDLIAENAGDNGSLPPGVMPKPGGPGMKAPPIIGGGKAPPIIGGNFQKPPGAQGPMDTPEDAPEIPVTDLGWDKLKKLDSELYTRLYSHKINIFHPFGQFPEETPAATSTATSTATTPMPTGPGYGGQAGAGGVERFGFSTLNAGGAGAAGVSAPGVSPGAAPMVMPKPGVLPGPGGFRPGAVGDASGTAPAAIYDALVRFVDLDVKPGHRYRYFIQVRFKNPNFGKKKDVAQQIFADIKELVADAPWTPTPEYSIPGTYHLFAVDQWRYDQMGEKDQNEVRRKMYSKEYKDDGEHAVFQLQRWFGKTENDPLLIGDWAVAERVRVQKGQPIGSQEMLVEMPTWSIGKGAFELRQTVKAGKGKQQKVVHAVPLDFVPRVTAPDGKTKLTLPPLLVDFEGGKKQNTKLLGSGVSEEAALDVLILMPDGRLIARNSRADIDAKIEPGTPHETTRQQRVLDWRKRNEEALTGGAAGGANGPGMPPGAAPPIIGPKR